MFVLVSLFVLAIDGQVFPFSSYVRLNLNRCEMGFVFFVKKGKKVVDGFSANVAVC